LAEQGPGSCPPDAAPLLSASEQAVLARLQVPKRRQEWLLGRLAAKSLVRHHLRAKGQPEAPLFAIVIEAAADGAPTVAWPGAGGHSDWSRLRISISHREGVAVAALSTAGPVGVDLELVEPRSAGFVEDYFTEAEQRRIRSTPAAERDVIVMALWSAKEAALKLCRCGLRADARAFCCTVQSPAVSSEAALGRPDASWHRTRARPDPARLRGASVDAPAGDVLGYWRRAGRLVIAVAVAPSSPPSGPIPR
jgi:4'-phosphopantetheinyl transferase